jgi:phenylalanine-4-hydroxylase
MISPAQQSFDITKLQPQLRNPTFAYLNLVLENLNKMALRTGGLSGIEKLINWLPLEQLN